MPISSPRRAHPSSPRKLPEIPKRANNDKAQALNEKALALVEQLNHTTRRSSLTRDPYDKSGAGWKIKRKIAVAICVKDLPWALKLSEGFSTISGEPQNSFVKMALQLLKNGKKLEAFQLVDQIPEKWKKEAFFKKLSLIIAKEIPEGLAGKDTMQALVFLQSLTEYGFPQEAVQTSIEQYLSLHREEIPVFADHFFSCSKEYVFQHLSLLAKENKEKELEALLDFLFVSLIDTTVYGNTLRLCKEYRKDSLLAEYRAPPSPEEIQKTIVTSLSQIAEINPAFFFKFCRTLFAASCSPSQFIDKISKNFHATHPRLAKKIDNWAIHNKGSKGTSFFKDETPDFLLEKVVKKIDGRGKVTWDMGLENWILSLSKKALGLALDITTGLIQIRENLFGELTLVFAEHLALKNFDEAHVFVESMEDKRTRIDGLIIIGKAAGKDNPEAAEKILRRIGMEHSESKLQYDHAFLEITKIIAETNTGIAHKLIEEANADPLPFIPHFAKKNPQFAWNLLKKHTSLKKGLDEEQKKILQAIAIGFAATDFSQTMKCLDHLKGEQSYDQAFSDAIRMAFSENAQSLLQYVEKKVKKKELDAFLISMLDREKLGLISEKNHKIVSACIAKISAPKLQNLARGEFACAIAESHPSEAYRQLAEHTDPSERVALYPVVLEVVEKILLLRPVVAFELYTHFFPNPHMLSPPGRILLEKFGPVFAKEGLLQAKAIAAKFQSEIGDLVLGPMIRELAKKHTQQEVVPLLEYLKNPFYKETVAEKISGDFAKKNTDEAIKFAQSNIKNQDCFEAAMFRIMKVIAKTHLGFAEKVVVETKNPYFQAKGYAYLASLV